MTPIKSHLSLTPKYVISIRTFLNRKQLEKNNFKLNDSINFKIYKRVVLSNRHLKELYDDETIKKKLITILLEMDKDELMALNDNNHSKNGSKNNEELKIPFGNEYWKCYLFINWESLLEIREFLAGGIIKHKELVNELLIREMVFDKSSGKKIDKEVVEIFDVDEDEEFINSEKKDFKWKYRSKIIIPKILNVHVYSKN